MPRPIRHPRAIGRIAETIVQPLYERQGFPFTDLITRWAEIVGPQFADCSAPERLKWPQRPVELGGRAPRRASARRAGATLIVRVEGPRSIELQHASSAILDRINTYFGYRAVTDLRCLQAPMVRATSAPRRPPRAERLETAPEDAQIDSPDLRQALARLRGARRLRTSERR